MTFMISLGSGCSLFSDVKSDVCVEYQLPSFAVKQSIKSLNNEQVDNWILNQYKFYLKYKILCKN